MPCGYCNVPGHDVTECPERLEEYYGTPADNFDEDDEEIVADGGVRWADLTGWVSDSETRFCPECQRYRIGCAHIGGER